MTPFLLSQPIKYPWTKKSFYFTVRISCRRIPDIHNLFNRIPGELDCNELTRPHQHSDSGGGVCGVSSRIFALLDKPNGVGVGLEAKIDGLIFQFLSGWTHNKNTLKRDLCERVNVNCETHSMDRCLTRCSNVLSRPHTYNLIGKTFPMSRVAEMS